MSDIGNMSRSAKAKEIIANFRKAKDKEPNRHEEYRELEAFYESKQYCLGSNRNSDKPWVIDIDTPHASNSIDTRTASIIANDYRGILFPLSPKEKEEVEKLNTLVENEWAREDYDKCIKRAIKSSAVSREAYIHLRYDPNKVYGATGRYQDGVLVPEYIHPASVYRDPNAIEVGDDEFIVVAERINRKKAEKVYNLSDEILRSSSFTAEDRGEIFADNDYNTFDDDTLTMLNYYEKEYETVRVANEGVDPEEELTDDNSISTIHTTVKYYRLIENTIVEEFELPVSQIPVVPFIWQRRAKSPYGVSLMDKVLSAQKSVNNIESAIVNGVLNAASPNAVVTEESGLDAGEVAKYIGVPGVVFKVRGDARLAISTVQMQPVSAATIQVKEQFKADIKETVGDTSTFGGNIGTAGNTAGGANAAIQRATVIENNVLEEIESSVEYLTKVLVEFITNKFEGRTIYTNLKRKGKMSFGEIEVTENLKHIGFSYEIDLEKRTPYSRERDKEELTQIYTIERQYDTDVKVVTEADIIKNSSIKNKDEILQRREDLQNKQDSDKAQVVMAFINEMSQLPPEVAPPELVSTGVEEIISGDEKTPTLDALLKNKEQYLKIKEQEEAQARENIDANLNKIAQKGAELSQNTQINENSN